MALALKGNFSQFLIFLVISTEAKNCKYDNDILKYIHKYSLSNYSFRIVWVGLFIFGVFYGWLLYTPVLDSWYYEPTVNAIDQHDFLVEKLPFPAITICSNNKIVYRQFESVLRTQPWKGLNKSIENFQVDFNSALTALVVAQDDPYKLKDLTKGAIAILNDYHKELPDVLKQVKMRVFYLHL